MSDPLAEVMRSVRLTGGVFLDVRLTAPWCLHSEMTAEDCKPFLTEPAQIVSYHVVTKGELLILVDGEPPVTVSAGEIVLLPRNDAHRVASEEGLGPVMARSLIRPAPNGGLARIEHGGGGPEMTMVCGFLGSEAHYDPVLSTLPRVLKIDFREATSRDWIEVSAKFAASELAQGRLAASNVMSRLSEVLLVEAIRQYAATSPDAAGWLKGIGDAQVGRALALMHADIAKPWSADALAKAAALSRSVFMNRFTELVGMPPIRYLTVRRLSAAKHHLRATRQSISQVARAVGYESEEAFSRAFKREFGVAPARWREAAQA